MIQQTSNEFFKSCEITRFDFLFKFTKSAMILFECLKIGQWIYLVLLFYETSRLVYHLFHDNDAEHIHTHQPNNSDSSWIYTFMYVVYLNCILYFGMHLLETWKPGIVFALWEPNKQINNKGYVMHIWSVSLNINTHSIIKWTPNNNTVPML